MTGTIPERGMAAVHATPTSLGGVEGKAGRIGPNAVIQTLRAVAELESAALRQALPERAALPDAAPTAMIPDEWFVRLLRAVRASLPPARAEAVLRRSGELTAAYVAKNRIPAPFRALLRILPPRLGIPLLLRAFRRHAWTFAGAGRFSYEGPYPGSLILEGGPTCRAGSTDGVVGHAGAYYEAAFEGLLRLAAPRVHVREVACQAASSPVCRFAVMLDESIVAGDPCASC